MAHWTSTSLSTFSAYMVSHDTISLTFKGEMQFTHYYRTKEIYLLDFLKYDAFEEILYLKQEETAVSLPWASTIIVNFWDIEKDKYPLFSIYEGFKTLFEMEIIKELKEVQFKFFANEQLDSLIKLKWIKSDQTNYFYFELTEENSYEINLQWRSSENMDKLELDRQLLLKSITKLFDCLGSNNKYQILDIVLSSQYDSIYVYFPSQLKLRIQTRIFEETQDQLRSVELFIHDGWFETSKYDLKLQYNQLLSLLQSHLNECEEKSVLDIALIFNEEQIACPYLMSEINSLIIKTLLTCNTNTTQILFSLMPIEIHFDLNVEKEQFNLDINLHHEDPQDLYQEGLVILLQALTNCQIFKELNVDIEQDEDSQNTKFQLFPFVMVISDFYHNLEGVLCYNNYQLLPRTGPICSKGIVNFLVTDKKSIFQITDKCYLDIQKQINCFLQYLSLNATLSQSIIISCDLEELQRSSKQFYTDTYDQVIEFLALQDFGLLDHLNRDSKYHKNVVDKLLLPTLEYLLLKKKVATVLIICQKMKMRNEKIKEMIEYLPVEYHCIGK